MKERLVIVDAPQALLPFIALRFVSIVEEKKQHFRRAGKLWLEKEGRIEGDDCDFTDMSSWLLSMEVFDYAVINQSALLEFAMKMAAEFGVKLEIA